MKKWERSNCLYVINIKTKVFASIRGLIRHHEKVNDLIKEIDEQFSTSNKCQHSNHKVLNHEAHMSEKSA